MYTRKMLNSMEELLNLPSDELVLKYLGKVILQPRTWSFEDFDVAAFQMVAGGYVLECLASIFPQLSHSFRKRQETFGAPEVDVLSMLIFYTGHNVNVFVLHSSPTICKPKGRHRKSRADIHSVFSVLFLRDSSGGPLGRAVDCLSKHRAM